MKMLNLVVGPMETNCYILYEDSKCLIIDPGDEENSIIKKIDKLKLTPVAILLTHNHFDHTEVIYTPGHSNTCLTYYFKDYDMMFVGDFIFKESIGRVDLPGGNYRDMIASLNKIKTYDDNIILYPGHGDSTTIGYEKKYNNYLK